jgi:hypothetical protein
MELIGHLSLFGRKSLFLISDQDRRSLRVKLSLKKILPGETISRTSLLRTTGEIPGEETIQKSTPVREMPLTKKIQPIQ